MPARRNQSMPLNQGIKIVAWRIRKQGPREFHRAQDTGSKVDAASLEFVFQKTVIKAGVVRDEQLARQTIHQVPGNCLKYGCIRTISSLMPVSRAMKSGIRACG